VHRRPLPALVSLGCYNTKERNSGFGGEQEGNKTFYSGERQLSWKEAKKHKCLEIMDN